MPMAMSGPARPIIVEVSHMLPGARHIAFGERLPDVLEARGRGAHRRQVGPAAGDARVGRGERERKRRER